MIPQLHLDPGPVATGKAHCPTQAIQSSGHWQTELGGCALIPSADFIRGVWDSYISGCQVLAFVGDAIAGSE